MPADMYPDFKLTEENCALEPIHRPIYIQGHGCLLVYSLKFKKIYAASESFMELLALDWSAVVDLDFKKWVPEGLQSFILESSLDHINTINQITLKGRKFDVLMHEHQDFYILELEESKAIPFSLSDLSRFSFEIGRCERIKDLCAVSTRLFKKFFHYDRVMIYKFDEDMHGSVIGEAKNENMQSFLNLHYPASDIPAQARELFLKKRSRNIYDIKSKNSPLLFNPHVNYEGYLDLSFSHLRATSNVHLEYLGNMGVTSSMTVAIIKEGQLWGLVACHHNSPYYVSAELRQMAEVFSDLFALAIDKIESHHYQIEQRQLAEYRDAFKAQTSKEKKFSTSFPDLHKACAATGAAIVDKDGVLERSGVIPSKLLLDKLRSRCVEKGLDEIHHSSHMSVDFDLPEAKEEGFGGVLSGKISRMQNIFVFWFLPSQVQTVRWAGDPDNSHQSTTNPKTNEVRMSPRNSFEQWKQILEDRSVRWKKSQIESAADLVDFLMSKEIEQVEDRVLQIVFAASHDLHEPLRTQSNYLELLNEEKEIKSNPNAQNYIKRLDLSIERMRQLITNLLDYARIDSRTESEKVDVHSVVQEILEDFKLFIADRDAAVEVGPMPSIYANRQDIKQLLSNLISNGIKYCRPGVPPVVKISSQVYGKHVEFKINDNGLGVDKKYFDKIFSIFQRLHSKDEYPGSGIGLAITKRISEKYEGFIRVDSTLGSGSTFFVDLYGVGSEGRPEHKS